MVILWKVYNETYTVATFCFDCDLKYQNIWGYCTVLKNPVPQNKEK